MNLKFYSPVVFVKDIGKAKKFYAEVLGQEIAHDFGANIVFKCRLSIWQIIEQHEISGIAGDAAKGKTFELYFETDSIEESVKLIKASGAQFFHEIKTEPWGQMTFRFFDPDGHLIEIGEAFEVFVQRIYSETRSVEETAKRTGVPEETIAGIVNKK